MNNKKLKDELRSNVIDELITADNWFTVVKEDNKVKLFTCTDAPTMRGIFLTLMTQEPGIARVIVASVKDYLNTVNCNGVQG